ncbi:MAG: DUF4258 domain-containing protein [Planctomycetota bacterium]|nr:DUF4258 domain-containing protein [Planctomycetota bacterium]MDI6787231.1 DUF4258 domain-containing protein [Planctomycetota bacterium]
MEISEIRKAFTEKRFRYTKHGAEQRIKRRITSEEIEQAILNGEIIEDYPVDKYGPSCLIYGETTQGRPLHIQVAFYPMISIVTVYEPSPEEWVNNKMRKSKNTRR